jgi:glycopeptide antibiotics resistance protein
MKKIEKDKWKHFYVGIGMGIVVQAFMTFLLPAHLVLATAIAFVLTVIISYGFELYSLFTGHGHYDLMDAIAGVVGGLAGMALLQVTKHNFFPV